MPTAEGDLRETFDLPSMTGEDADLPTSAGAGSAADAASLFRADQAPTRKPGAAESRAKARRCPTCGGVVPVGMALCTTCGYNLETGVHVGLDDDLDVAPQAPRSGGLPIGVLVIGGISALGSLVLTIVSIIRYVEGNEGSQGFGLLALICVFSLYASVQFLRGRSVKLLIVALSLGALVALIGLIALPIWRANAETPEIHQIIPEDPFEEGPAIQPLVDRLDYTSLNWGIASLLAYAAVVVYLASPGVRRHFAKTVHR